MVNTVAVQNVSQGNYQDALNSITQTSLTVTGRIVQDFMSFCQNNPTSSLQDLYNRVTSQNTGPELTPRVQALADKITEAVKEFMGKMPNPLIHFLNGQPNQGYAYYQPFVRPRAQELATQLDRDYPELLDRLVQPPRPYSVHHPRATLQELQDVSNGLQDPRHPVPLLSRQRIAALRKDREELQAYEQSGRSLTPEMKIRRYYLNRIV